MAIKPKPRNAYDRQAVRTGPGGPPLTKQDQKDDCDVNQILRKFVKTGVIEHMNEFQGNYGDFTAVQDFQTSQLQVKAAEEMFMSLPSEIRKQFANDAGNFIDFVGDPENESKMREMGLLPKQSDPEPEGGAGEAAGASPEPAPATSEVTPAPEA